MTDTPTIYVPLPVPCSGCGEPVSYEVGGITGSYGEFRLTSLGYSFHRTHPTEVCIEAMRTRVGGREYTPPEPPATVERRSA